MPRVRFGKVHLLNCLYSSSVTNYCIGAGYLSNIYAERCVYDIESAVWRNYATSGNYTDYNITVTGSIVSADDTQQRSGDNEYFILENRQQRGWDAYLPGHGMLMWHIDMDEEAWMNNMVNIDPSHQRVDIVEADGIGSDASMTGDPFPGTGRRGIPVLQQRERKHPGRNDVLHVPRRRDHSSGLPP